MRGDQLFELGVQSSQIRLINYYPKMPYRKITASNHRKIENKRLGSPPHKRNDFNSEREQYWNRRWGEG